MNKLQIKILEQLGYSVETVDRDNHKIINAWSIETEHGTSFGDIMVTELDTRMTTIKVSYLPVNKNSEFYKSYDEFLNKWFDIPYSDRVKQVWVEHEISPSSLSYGQIVSHEPVTRDDY